MSGFECLWCSVGFGVHLFFGLKLTSFLRLSGFVFGLREKLEIQCRGLNTYSQCPLFRPLFYLCDNPNRSMCPEHIFFGHELPLKGTTSGSKYIL